MGSAQGCCATMPNKSASIRLSRSTTGKIAPTSLNLVRHELGFSKMESRFPTKGTCLAIYSRAVNAELPLDDVLRDFYPWCAGWSAQLRELFAAYVEAKQAQNVLDYDDLLLYWAQTVSDPLLAERYRRPVRPCAGR